MIEFSIQKMLSFDEFRAIQNRRRTTAGLDDKGSAGVKSSMKKTKPGHTNSKSSKKTGFNDFDDVPVSKVEHSYNIIKNV